MDENQAKHFMWKFNLELLLPTEVSQTVTKIRGCISSYTHIKQWCVITYPYPNFYSGLIKTSWKDIDG